MESDPNMESGEFIGVSETCLPNQKSLHAAIQVSSHESLQQTYTDDATWTESDNGKQHVQVETEPQWQAVPEDEPSVEKVDKVPRVRDYGDFARGNTVPDPVSQEDAEGRVWQNYRPDKYFLPNDAIEQDRLDFTHRFFCLQLQLLQDPAVRSKSPDDALIL